MSEELDPKEEVESQQEETQQEESSTGFDEIEDGEGGGTPVHPDPIKP